MKSSLIDLALAFNHLNINDELIKISKIIKVPEEFWSWWNNNKHLLVEYYILSNELKKDLEFPNSLEVKNKYKILDTSLIININFIYDLDSNNFGLFNYETNTIEIFTYVGLKNSDIEQKYWIENKYELEFSLRQILIHELIHAIDPKLNSNDKIYNNYIKKHIQKNKNEFNNDFEFDAYCSEIIEFLKTIATKQNIIKLLKKPLDQMFLGFPRTFKNVINNWSYNEKNKFRVRLFEELNQFENNN